jgi:uncharacterized small protein (DUF1192 family)
MTEREDVIQQIAELEARRSSLMAEEGRLHAIFMAEDDESAAKRTAVELEDICGELDEISDKIGCAEARLYLIEAEISRREKIRDTAYGSNP